MKTKIQQLLVSVVFLCLNVLCSNFQSPKLRWNKFFGSDLRDRTASFTTDSYRNIYITGSFQNTDYMGNACVACFGCS